MCKIQYLYLTSKIDYTPLSLISCSASLNITQRILSGSTRAVPALVRAAGRRQSPRVSRAMSYLYHQMPHAPPAGSWSKPGQGGVSREPSLRSPTTTEWACIDVPTSWVTSPTTPPSLFPPDGPDDSATKRSHTGKRGNGGRDGGGPFPCRLERVPYFAVRVVRAHCPPWPPRSTPSTTSHWPDLSPEFW